MHCFKKWFACTKTNHLRMMSNAFRSIATNRSTEKGEAHNEWSRSMRTIPCKTTSVKDCFEINSRRSIRKNLLHTSCSSDISRRSRRTMSVREYSQAYIIQYFSQMKRVFYVTRWYPHLLNERNQAQNKSIELHVTALVLARNTSPRCSSEKCASESNPLL